ncbi:zinc finger protein 395 isoform X2 [Drosophila virilis]|uniref:zinc finger protein 395 isoform X2 n=1 Tax=Drosophila virilis TaxID=7244 RepID=UPI0013964F0C|nr:zinc finger protein 704 isoform X2 [Drosophila virilis]
MSTSRRLAKRSIIGTKVCAPGPDGLWYSGVIQDVKTPTSMSSTPEPMPPPTFLAPGDAQLNADTRYIVRFDFKTQSLPSGVAANASGSVSLSASGSASASSESVIVETRRAAAAANVHISPAQALRRNAMTKEFRESDLIGPGFRSIMSIQLQPGQRIFLTYNGREQSGDVVLHDVAKDEVVVKITPAGNEEPIELKKRLEEVRLLESRRSARLADQDRDTDFARLADMGGDRRRTTHSIEVPLTPLTPPNNSRKRPPSDSYDCSSDQCKVDDMNECNAALILMNLHNSPHAVSDKWLGSSPGSSSSASWSSGSASPPLSDDGNVLHGHIILSPQCAASASANARIRTTSVSTSDEGIVIDFKEERKKKLKKFRCTWKGCGIVEPTQLKIERHVRDKHLGKKARRSGDNDSCSDNEHEEEFYYTEDDDDDELVKTPSPASPPTLSHRDMARPPHEDPEYQRQIVGNFKQGRAMNNYHHLTHQQAQLHHNSSSSSSHGHITSTQHQQLQSNNTSCIPTSPLAHHNYTWPSTGAITVSASSTNTHQAHHSSSSSSNGSGSGSSSATLNKQARASSTRPSHSTAPYPSPTYVHHHHHNYSNSSIGSAASSSNSSNSSSSNSSPVIHSNSSANNMLQQLSQQNVTVTAHHSHNSTGVAQAQQHQQQHHLSGVTITANYSPPQQQQQQQQQHQQHQQQHLRGQQQTTASNNLVANSGQHMPMQHVAVQQAVSAARNTPNSPNRRTRGENKKCRKVYGMERRDQWCTQCRWKKACSRFGD